MARATSKADRMMMYFRMAWVGLAGGIGVWLAGAVSVRNMISQCGH